MLLVNLLSSLAIFVGRFDRLHSIHIVTKPVQTLQIIFFKWSTDKVQFILLLTGVQLLLLACIVGLDKMKLGDKV